MTKITTKMQLAQLESYANTFVQSIRLLDERRYILEPLLENEEIKKGLSEKLNKRQGVNAYNRLVPLLGQDIIRDISRTFLDEDSRSASFVNIYRKANAPKIYRALKNKFMHIPDKWHKDPIVDGFTKEEAEKLFKNLLFEDRATFEKSFNEGMETVSKSIENLKKDEIAEKIKTFRDKYLAHLEMTPLGQDPGPFNVKNIGLTYNDIPIFLNQYHEPAFELARIITGTVNDINGFSKIHQKAGLDMWACLAGVGEA